MIDDTIPSTWIIERMHVSAAELGTSQPWIPLRLYVEADYYNFDSNSRFFEFKDARHKVVFAIERDYVKSVTREGTDVQERDNAIELLTAAETGALLNISRQAVLLMVERKQIPAFRLGRNYVFNRRDVEKRLKTPVVREKS